MPRTSTPSAQAIREALNRKALASARHRTALGRLLRLSDNEVLAVLHVGRAGALTPTELAHLLSLTSGGATALIHRLERGGHVTRERHPVDGRSSLLRLTPETERSASALMAPLVRDLDELIGSLSAQERATVGEFLAAAAQRTEAHADDAQRAAEERARLDLGEPVPGLWS